MSLSLSQSYSLNSWLFKYTVYLEGSLSTASAGRKRQKWKDWFTILVQTMSSSIKGKLHINWFATLVKTVSSGFKGKLHIKACLQTLGNTTASVKKEDNKCEVVKVLKWYPLIQCCFRMKSTSWFPFLIMCLYLWTDWLISTANQSDFSQALLPFFNTQLEKLQTTANSAQCGTH